MRILFTMHSEPDPNGGVAGVTTNLANELKRKGHIVDIVSFEGLKGNDLYKAIKFPWFIYNKLKSKLGEYDILDMTSGDGWILQKTRNNRNTLFVTRSHGLEHLAVAGAKKLARNKQLKLSWKYPIYHAGYRLYECRQSFANADLSIFLNKADRNYAVNKLGVEQNKSLILPNGINERFILHAQTLDQTVFVQSHKIAFIGSWLPIKGINTFAAAMTELLTKSPALSIGIFGTKIPDEHVLSFFPTSLHNRISITPFYDNRNLPTLLENYSIFVSSSISEGFALAPLEAMACGLVPIITDIPGPTEYVIDKHNGVIVDPSNVATLVNAVATLASNANLWSNLRANAITTAQAYSWESIATKLEHAYRSALANKVSHVR